MPVQARVVVPLGSLAELATHEKQLLAGLGELVAVKKSEIRDLLPLVAGHAGEQRAFAVYDLVVRQRQDEMLAVRIDRPEGQPVVMPGAVNGITGEVVERVMHPAHVPLEAEAEPTRVGRPGDPRPRRGLLRDHHDVGKRPVHLSVAGLEKLDRLEVLVATEAVRDPLSALARVVEVEHRSHPVHAQPVGMEPVEPEARAGDQEAANLTAAEVEDPALPVGVHSLADVGVLIEMSAVETRLAGEMSASDALYR